MITSHFSLRRVATVALLLATCLFTTACGTGTVGAVGLAGADHTKFAHTHSHLMSDVRCGWHSYRAIHDMRHHHLLFGALQTYESIHNCRRALHR